MNKQFYIGGLLTMLGWFLLTIFMTGVVLLTGTVGMADAWAGSQYVSAFLILVGYMVGIGYIMDSDKQKEKDESR